MENQKVKYVHSEEVHNLKDPDIIVPIVNDLIKPQSVVDVGCGLGTFLYAFKGIGVTDVLGVDGPWVQKELLSNYLSENEFLETNLEGSLKLDKVYDLVISLEVAEHLSVKSADVFVENLVNAGKVILFSAALPNQGGQNHINEQPITYWAEKFAKHGYQIKDVIRPLIWDDSRLFYWYKQNSVLFVSPGTELPVNIPEIPIHNLIHYELFEKKIKEYQEKLEHIQEGHMSSVSYFKLFIKSLLGENQYQRLKKLLTR